MVYTMWNNLKKTAAMDVGQVSFHRDKGKSWAPQAVGHLRIMQTKILIDSFHIDVRKVRVDKRINEIVNRLNKTKVEEHPGIILLVDSLCDCATMLINVYVCLIDFRDEREKRDAKEREDKKSILREQKEREKDEEKQRKETAELKSYASLMSAENMTSNYDDGNESDDFM